MGKLPELCLLTFMFYLQESNYGKANLLSVLSQPPGLLPKMTCNLLKGVHWGNVQLHRFSTFFKCNQTAAECVLWGCCFFFFASLFVCLFAVCFAYVTLYQCREEVSNLTQATVCHNRKMKEKNTSFSNFLKKFIVKKHLNLLLDLHEPLVG